MEKVAFIGLGAMGTPMAWNVHRAGFSLGVYNRTVAACEPLRDAGIAVYRSPREAAKMVDAVVIMVTGPTELHAVLDGDNGVLEGITSGKLVINMSTVSPEATLEAAERLDARGAGFVDAPVSGSVKPAEERTLVVLAGGENWALERAEPLLLAMGKQVVRCGGVGQGTRMKLVLNLMLGNLMQSLAEGMELGSAFGLPVDSILEALAGGAMNAPMFQLKGAAIRDGDFASQFPVHLMCKDLNLVLDGAGAYGVPLPQTAATRECFNAAVARGLGGEDMAAVSKVLHLLSGRG